VPRSAGDKAFNTFTNGIITEASPLTFPENASLDEANFVLNRDGTRQRRLGMDFEENFAFNTNFSSSSLLTDAMQVIHWYNAGDDGSNNFAVVQVASRLFFYNIEADSVSANKKAFEVNLDDFAKPANVAPDAAIVQGASGRGLLIIVGEQIEPFYVEYNASTDTITTAQITIEVRDFLGVDDGIPVDARPSSLSKEHKYNLLNQGWTNGNISSAFSAFSSAFPSNADVISLARKDDNTLDFSLSTDTTLVGNTAAPKGHFVVNAFSRSKEGMSTTVDSGRPTTTVFFAGRVWYAGVNSSIISGSEDNHVFNDTLFFSSTLLDKNKIGDCYQEADPTNENISDLIDSDGGTINIPEMGTVLKLISLKDSLVIFADNGVWQLAGDNGAVFTATVFSINQITSTGAVAADSIVKLEDKIVYWSDEGIFAIQQDLESGLIVAANIIKNNIQTLYLEVTPAAKLTARGSYDNAERKVKFLYTDDEDADGVQNRFKYNKELTLDLDLEAWTVNTIGELATLSPFVAGYIDTPFDITSTVPVTVVVGGNTVLASGDEVFVNFNSVEKREVTTTKYLTVVPTSSTHSSLTFSSFNNTSFLDWESQDSVGVDKEAFLSTGHFLAGDIAREKQVTYLMMHFLKTETGFIEDDAGEVVLAGESSALVQVRWDWNNSSAGGRFSKEFQAYRFRRRYIPTGSGDLFDTGEEVIYSKSKIRGKGKALSLNIRTEAGKDMHLLGWHLAITGTTQL